MVTAALLFGAGVWLMAQNGRRDNRAATTEYATTTTPASTSPATPSPTRSVPIPEPSTPPALTIGDIVGALDDPEIAEDPSVAPWLGMSVQSSDGTLYHYGDGVWTSVKPDGGIWVLPERTATAIVRDGRITIDSPDSNHAWAAAVLAETPGLEPDAAGFVIVSPTLYRDGIVTTAKQHHVWVDQTASDSVELVSSVTRRPAWVEPRDGFIWIMDESAAVLVAEAGEELAVAGRLVPDPVSGSVWEPAPDADLLKDAVDAALSALGEEPNSSGGRKVPLKVNINPSTEELAKFESKRVPLGSGESSETMLILRREGRGDCPWYGCAVQELGSALEGSWDATVNATSDRLGDVDLTALSCAGVDGGVFCGYSAAKTTIDAAKATTDFFQTLWELKGNVFAEKNCGTGGPHAPGDPEGKNREFPPANYETLLASVEDRTITDFPDRLQLARAWMPLIELSNEEQCGEILRVFANVNAYTPDGGSAGSLAEAARVEIAYTLFFKYDGGRFEILGKDHPGDNEGFVIGLVRTDTRAGLCSTGFEFMGGRTVAHSNKGGAIVTGLEINKRQIDDFTPADIGTPCPDPNPNDRNDPWRILVAEGKHATYYHRDGHQQPREGIPFPGESHDPNGTNCEAALGPRLIPALAAYAALGGPIGTITSGIPLAEAGALATDYLIKNAPPDLRAYLEDGLEECEQGRDLLDLSYLVELFDNYVAAGNRADLGFSTNATYETEDGPRTYMEQARGRPCFDRPQCLNADGQPDDFHVPNLFSVEAAPPPGALVSVPDTIGRTLSQAQVAILNAEFVPVDGGTTPVDDPALDGVVALQVPVSGTEVQIGSSVTVYIGDYDPPLVVVPDVGGLPEASAISVIEASDLVAEIAGEIETSDSGFVGRVMDQDPLSGQVPTGTTIRIWIGVADDSGSEPPSPPPGGELDPSKSGDHTVSLQTGFGPDPHLTQFVDFGGSLAIDVSYLGGNCVGEARPRPTYEVYWTGSGDLLRFFFYGGNGADTTMVVRDPGGGWYCNDDSYSTLHPTVSFPSAQSGVYKVWIGTFQGGGSGDFYITELPENHPWS